MNKNNELLLNEIETYIKKFYGIDVKDYTPMELEKLKDSISMYINLIRKI